MNSTSATQISCLDEYEETMEASIVTLVDEMSHILKESYSLSIPQKCNGFLSRCLRVKDYNVNKAAKLVRNVHRSTQSLHDMLDKFRPKYYHDLYFTGTITLLRNRDYKGRQVLVSRVGKFDPKEFDFDESTAAQILLFSCAVAKSPETQRNGVVFLFDLTSFGLKHVKAFRPTRLLQLVSMMQDASPAKIKGIHLIFHPRIFGAIYQMVRPLLTDKIAKRVFFHGDNLDSLHKFVDPSILPVSLGGAKGELEAVDLSFLNELIQEDNIHRDMKAHGVPAF